MLTSDQLVRRVFFGLTILFIVFIIYASWTPGSGGVSGERVGFDRPQSVGEVFGAHDLRDIATNVLLYMPLGFFLALATMGRRPRIFGPWILVGLAVSLMMEVGQMFIGRTPDVVDLVTNGLGYLIGYMLVMIGAQRYGLDPRVLLGIAADQTEGGRTQTIAAARFIYISIYVLVALLPFDVSVSLERIYAQLFPDSLGQVRLILDPTYHLSRWGDSGIKITVEFLGLVPIAALTAVLSGIKGRISAFGAIFAAVAVAVACEVCQVFILSRTTDIVMLPLAVVAGVSGWALVRSWLRLQPVEVDPEAVKGGAAWRSLAVAIIGYAFVILFFAWSPFRFETDPVAVGTKILHDSNLVPFKEHFAVRSLGSAIDIVKEVGLFLPLGVLFAYLFFDVLPNATRQRVIVLSGLACMAFATFTELAQAVSIGRYMDITDIFLAGAGGAAGAVLLRLFQSVKVIPAQTGPSEQSRRRRRKGRSRRYW